jgi:hypothetical protein
MMLHAAAFLLLAIQAPAASSEETLREYSREWGYCVGRDAMIAMLANREQPLDPVIDSAFEHCLPEQARLRAEWTRLEGEERVEAQFPALRSMVRARAVETVRAELANRRR